MLSKIQGKTILLIGMARSGIAAAALLVSCGAGKVIVADRKPPEDLAAGLEKLKRFPTVETVTGSTPAELVTSHISMIVKSPGVPPNLELFKIARGLNIPVISEVELAYTFLKTPMIGVTGTNGKTTTTAIITEILREAGFEPVVSAGNIGNPLSELVGRFSSQGFIVAELSSFQLDDTINFRPFVSLFINFAEDHLDYHGTRKAYLEAKAKIFANQHYSDYAVLNAGDPTVAAYASRIKARPLWFDRKPVSFGVGVEDEMIKIFNLDSQKVTICPISGISLPGEHNLENSLAAAAAAWAAGADPGAIGRVLTNFKAITHRLEPAGEVKGVTYVNDSKGTNPGSTIKALQAYSGRNIILIAGGKDKGASFTELAGVIAEAAAMVLLLGETAPKIEQSLKESGFRRYQRVADLGEAVQKASQIAQPGDIVLLSPACASWDMFSDYEARGNLFKDLVCRLNNRDGEEHHNGR